MGCRNCEFSCGWIHLSIFALFSYLIWKPVYSSLGTVFSAEIHVIRLSVSCVIAALGMNRWPVSMGSLLEEFTVTFLLLLVSFPHSFNILFWHKRTKSKWIQSAASILQGEGDVRVLNMFGVKQILKWNWNEGETYFYLRND